MQSMLNSAQKPFPTRVKFAGPRQNYKPGKLLWNLPHLDSSSSFSSRGGQEPRVPAAARAVALRLLWVPPQRAMLRAAPAGTWAALPRSPRGIQASAMFLVHSPGQRWASQWHSPISHQPLSAALPQMNTTGERDRERERDNEDKTQSPGERDVRSHCQTPLLHQHQGIRMHSQTCSLTSQTREAIPKEPGGSCAVLLFCIWSWISFWQSDGFTIYCFDIKIWQVGSFKKV